MKEIYEALEMDVITFNSEDVIATSLGPVSPDTPPAFTPDTYEMPIGF